jgi:hypothetical protein
MKKIFTLALMALPTFLLAQISFEQGFPKKVYWTIFANGSGDTIVTIVKNPAKSTENMSDSVLMFNTAADASAWAGFFTDSIKPIEITEKNATFTMAVYKEVISNVDLKLEVIADKSFYEMKVSNTITGDWETLTFDFTNAIGNTYDRLTIIPDFPDGTVTGSKSYIDNISSIKAIGDKVVSVSTAKFNGVSIFPNPCSDYISLRNINKGTKVVITDVVGKQSMTYVLKASGEKIPLTNLKAGVYFISSMGTNNAFTCKFIKK